MKNIKPILVFILSLFMTGAIAQLAYGPKIGLNLANHSGDDADNSKMLVAFNLGAVGNYTITDMFGVQAELLYDKKGAKYEWEGAGGNTSSAPLSLGYLSIPIMGVANFDVGGVEVFGLLGPTISFLLSAKYDGKSEYDMPVWDPQQPWLPPTTEKVKYKEWYKGTDFGLAIGAGAGIPVSTVVIRPDIRYNFGFGTIHAEPDSDSNEQQETIRNGVLSFNVTVFFGGAGVAAAAN